MAERVIALTIKVKGTTEENKALANLQHSVDSLKRQLSSLRKEENEGLITAKQAAAQRSQLNLQLKANQNAYRDLEASVLKSNDALRKNSGFVEGIKKGIQGALPSFTQLAGAFGLAFGAGEVVGFLKDSVKAFLEAEVNANKLAFAIKNIGKESTASFDKLIKQSEELQDVGIFSDDSIQQAQTALVQFGLTSDQVEKLIPQILDLASAQGIDLTSATDKVISAINGQTKGLKDAGIAFEDTGSKTKNLAIVQEKLGKFVGSTGNALETTAGQADRLGNVIDDLQEKIGGLFVSIGSTALDFFDVITGKKSLSDLATRDLVAKSLEKFKTLELEEKASFLRRLNTQIESEKNANKHTLAIRKALTEELRRDLEKRNKIEDDLTIKGQQASDKRVEERAKELELTKKIPQELKREEADLAAETKKANDELAKTKEILTDIKPVAESSLDGILDDFTELEAFLIENKDNIIFFANEAVNIASGINDIANAQTDARIKNIDRETEAQLTSIDKQIEAQKALGNNTDALEKQKQQIQEQSAKKIEAEQRKQFERDKELSIARALISGAEATIKAYSLFGPPPSPLGIAAAITAGITAALQVAAIAKQTFADGGIVPSDTGGIIKGRSHSQGGVKFNVGGVTNEAQGGEPILVKAAGDDPVTRNILSQINVAKGGRAFSKGGIVPSHKYQLGGITPSFSTLSASRTAEGLTSGQLLGMINQMVDGKIANIKVTNVASETATTNSKVNNIQSEVNFRG